MAAFIVPLRYDRATRSYLPLIEKAEPVSQVRGIAESRIKVVEQLQGRKDWEYAISLVSGWHSGFCYIRRDSPDDPWPRPIQEAIDAYAKASDDSGQGAPARQAQGGLLRHKWAILFLVLFIPTSLYMLGNGAGSLSWQQIEAELFTNAIILSLVVGALWVLMWALTKVWRATRGNRHGREDRQSTETIPAP